MRLSSRLGRRWGLRRVYALGCATYATGFLLWGLIEDPTVVSLLTVFEGVGFALLFTTGVVIVGKMLPPTLYSTGQSMAITVGLGVAPILGAGIGGFVYDALGPLTLYASASTLALATVGVAVQVELSNGTIGRAGIGLTGVGTKNIEAAEAAASLEGKEPNEEAFAEAGRLAAAASSPSSDVRGSAEYKRHVVEVFVKRGLARAVEMARG